MIINGPHPRTEGTPDDHHPIAPGARAGRHGPGRRFGGPGAAAAQSGGDRTVLSTGHVDAMQVTYDDGGLGLRVKDDTGDAPVYRDPGDVLFHVVPEAETAIPAEDRYRFLGDAGDSMWLLPLSQDPELLWTGWSTEPLSRGQFENDTVTMSLVGAEGPGEVVLWSVDTFGQPQVRFSSRDGLPDAHGVNVPAHVHSIWSFTATGSYTLTWKVTGTLADGATVTTGEVDYRWHVGELTDEPGDPEPPDDPDLDDRLVLDQGHVDVFSVDLDGDALSLDLKDDTRLHDDTAVVRDPDEVAFHAVPEAKTELTSQQLSQPGWDALGEPGDTVWWLPDTDQQGLLFPGWSTESIQGGELAGDAITLSLTDAEGPGDLTMFQIGDFGDASVLMDSGDGLPDAIDTRSNTHAHANWLFTEPGVYTLTWRAEAELPDGTAVHSDPEQYVFVVDEWPDGDPGDPGDPDLENTQTITATVDTDTGGLVISVDPDDRTVTLPAMTLNGTATAWTTEGELRPVTVTDTRSADPGWNATGQVSDFSSGDRGFEGGHLGWSPNLDTSGESQDVRPGPVVDGLLEGGPGLGSSQVLASATEGAGNGTAVLGADLTLRLPTDVESGTYTALVTFTAI
ncbi:hypothetical protein GCM10029992_49470 [Glycomyces albus]